MKFRSVHLFFFLFIVLNNAGAQAPGCPDVDAGSDQNLNCTTNCTNLSATIFQSGATTDYSVASIAYAPPYPFTGGTRVFINVDDEWTGIINLPFNFCFYGNQYNRIIIGTNGVLSFDVSMANNFCAWNFNSSIPTPGPPPGIYNNSINGAFHDIDPNVFVPGTSFPFFPTYPANINYAVLGAAPCRTFVVNFSTVRHYSCNSLETTQQIVLYETTNAIEVYIKDKPTCTSWNDGNAVIGLQNIDGTKGITPPNRNTGPWSTNNEAWRFTPNGTPNWTLTWYDAANNSLGNTPTISVCPTGTSIYRVEGVYQACDGTTVVVQDQVTINIAGGFTTSYMKTNESCAGCDGAVTVSVTGGTAPFAYNIGNGFQASSIFSGLCAGSYTMTVQDFANCSGTFNVVIDPSATITVTEAFTNETCAGLNDGTITLMASGGTSPYDYDIGFGAPNNTGVFAALPPNTYSYSVTDATGCAFSGTVAINTAQVCCNMINTVASGNNSCNGACDGSITLTENLGIAPVQFSIDNGTNFQPSGIFSELCAGTYNILIEDAGGCQFTNQIVITEPAAIVVSATPTDATCGCDGAINVSANGGAGAPFQYSIDNGAFQSGTTFSNVCPGNHTITAQDADGCPGTTTTTVANTGNLSIISITSANPSCNLICDASILINATGAVDYSIDNGITFQAGNSFINLCAGVYNIVVTDGGICQITDVVTITDPAAISLTAAASYVQCNGDCNGSIDNNATGGTLPYEYSIDNGANFQLSNQFVALCPGTYTFLVADANNCTTTVTTSVIEPLVLSVSITPTDASCPQLCNGTVDIAGAGGVTPYSFSLPGTTPTNSSPITGLCAGDFELTVTDANSCTVTSNFTINEPIGITISAGADDSVRIGESIILNPTFSDANFVNTVIWSPPVGLNCIACVNPVARPLTTTIYTLSVDDVNGCDYTDAVEIIVFSNPLVNIPNAFTPNRDGVNDIFLITGWEIDKFQMFIFNRWGEKVFETNILSTGWDGSYSGKTLPPDVYVYRVDVTYLTGDKEIFKGSLTLLK